MRLRTSFAIPGDASHLTRMFTNLLVNAARHTPADGRITLSARSENRCVVVTIADTGEGIPSEHLRTLWSAFTASMRLGRVPQAAAGWEPPSAAVL